MLAELVSIQSGSHFLLLLNVTDIHALNHTAFEITMQITANIEMGAKRQKKKSYNHLLLTLHQTLQPHCTPPSDEQRNN